MEGTKRISPNGALHRIVWHDFVTTDVPAAMRFYENLLGWEYLIKRSTDFVWRSGEADYPLIIR